MPIYEYQCKGCCHCFEYLALTATDTPTACPACACPDIEKLMSAGCVRAQGIAKGSGGFDAKPGCRPSG